MNISLNTENTLSPLLSAWERTAASSDATGLSARGDVVDLMSQNRQARLLDDAEVEGTLASTLGMIGADPYSALSVHGGLDAARVAALLA